MTVRDRVEETLFIDTHEHLLEESMRTSGTLIPGRFPCDDWSYLFFHYLGDDLASAGMPAADREVLYSPDASTETKAKLLEPWWQKVKHTGYGRAVRTTLREVYHEDDFSIESASRLEGKYRELVKPGFYRRVLERAGVLNCQVNSLERIFMQTEHPTLLRQDLSIVALGSGFSPKDVEADSGKTATTLDGWLEIVDWYFAEYGSQAVAVKSQSAYNRRLNFLAEPRHAAERIFAVQSAGDDFAPGDQEKLQNFLMRYCIGKATEMNLPVKLHTGYYAGHGYMPLDRVGQNARDLCPLLQDFPDTKFVLMHIGYPYQQEFIALAKHYPNVYLDLCWAWIIDPNAATRFVMDFLTAVPSNKLLTFGGDYLSVENVVGHSRIARDGLINALDGLAASGWLRHEEALELVEPLMRGNAEALFPAAANSL